MVKVKLSLIDRAQISNMLPKSGNVELVRKVQGWVTELDMTQSEKEVESSFKNIRDKDEQSKALNEWYDTPKDCEVSDSLFEFISEECRKRDENNSVSVNDSVNVYDQFLCK